jgi:hypothetical protein
MFLDFSDGRPISSCTREPSADRLNEYSNDNVGTFYGLKIGATVSMPVEFAKVEFLPLSVGKLFNFGSINSICGYLLRTLFDTGIS